MFIALLLAFLLVWAVLLGQDIYDIENDANHLVAVQQATDGLCKAIGDGDGATATTIVRASESQYNALRKQAKAPSGIDDLLFQLEDSDGVLRYASAALGGLQVRIDTAAARRIDVHGRVYLAAACETRQGRVTLLEPRLSGFDLLMWLALQELPSLLLAFPFVLVPAWLAVHRGMRPLRSLVARVSTRTPDDFSPLNMHLPYTELQPLVQTIDALLARSRQGIARERAVVQDAAHELRTPLAVITAQAHALIGADRPELQAQAKVALESAVQRASHLVHQLLTLARLEGPKTEAPQTVDLVAVTRQIIIAVTAALARPGIEVALDSPEQLSVEFDLMAFHSVLENLLRNAIAYGRDKGHVVVSLQPMPAGRIGLSVRDDGPGIAAVDRPHLFDRFHRGRDVQPAGAGLGLAIVKQAIERLGGSIELSPGLDGQGIGFVVTLDAKSN